MLSQDLPIVLTLIAAAWSAILAGSLLVPRGQIMMAEAASHAILPGVIIGFLLSGEMGIVTLAMAVLTIFAFIAAAEFLGRRHKLGKGVEIAALFPLFFGVGILLLSATGLEDTGAIDIDHVLFGSVELLLWLDVFEWRDLFRLEAWQGAPPQMLTALINAGIATGICVLAYPALKRSLIDRKAHRLSSPLASWLTQGLSIIVVALAAAACLRATGVVVAIALFSAPVVGAWAFARTLWQVWVWAVSLAVIAIALAYGTATIVAGVAGIELRLSGLLAVVLVLVALASPLVAKRLSRFRRRP